MELLVFGHAGQPVIVFPTSGARFFQFEEQGMVAALAGKIEAGQLQLFCLDSVDQQSWYNRGVPPRRRIERHMQYEQYVTAEVVPFIQRMNADQRLLALGCSFGGYHAVNIALRHPELFHGFVSFSGVFNLARFLDGYCDQDCYFHLPTFYLPHLSDPWYLNHFRDSQYILATGWDDQCLEQNQDLNRLLNEKYIPHQFHVWGTTNSHDWPTWRQMAQQYL
jgi:esterase/lipase superfamily enzyme